MSQLRTSRTFDVIFVALLGVIIWQAYVHRVGVGDWVYFQTHSPSAHTQNLATQANLTDSGKRLLERGDPQLVSLAELTRRCGDHLLGCLDEKGFIYILDDPTNPDQAIVTAAHEMLHLAYRRLSDTDRASLKAELEQGIAGAQASGIEDELEGSTDAEDRLDEAHSLLGTEYPDLPAGLERYYERYFTDRQAIVKAAAASER